MPSTPTQQIAETEFDVRVIKAMRHPLRMRLLTLLNQEVASPRELAIQLDERLGNVAYHMRVLAKLGVIELVKTKPRRGAVEHYYRALERPWFREQDWTALPAPLRLAISSGIVTQIWEDTASAIKSGSFDARDDRHLSRTPLALDDQGFKEVGAMLDEMLDRALEIQAESAQRIAEAGASPESLASHLVMMHYPAPKAKSRARPQRRSSKRSK